MTVESNAAVDNRTMRLPPKSIGVTAALVTILIWTSFIVIARASASLSLNPMDIVFARLAGAGLVLLPWGWWLVRQQRRNRPDAPGATADSSFFGLSPLPLRTTVLIGSVGGVFHSMLAYSGFFFAPAAHASVLLPGSLPMWTALLTVFLLRERIPGPRLFGLALILLGVLLVGGRSLLEAFSGGDTWKGDLLFLGAGFSWSCYAVLARRHQLDAVRATIAVSVFAVIVFMPGYLLAVASGLLPSRLLAAPLAEVLLQATFQGIVSVAISGITFTTMVRHFGPVRSTMMTAVVPGLSALAAVLFLGESLGWNLILGLTVVTLGMLFGLRAGAPGALRAKDAVAPAAGWGRNESARL